jgi:predicted transcriptional regulator
MNRSREDIEAHAAALTALIDAAQTGVADTSAQVRQTLTQDLDAAEAALRTRLDNAQRTIQAGLATTDEALTRRAQALEALVSAAEKGIGQASDDALAVLERDMEAMETDLRRRLDAALQRAQETLAVTDGGLSSQTASLDALINRSRESLTAIGDQTVAGLSDTIGDVESRLHQINDLIEGQRSLMSGLHSGLHDTIASTEDRFAALEDSALARGERLTGALMRMTEETQRIDRALAVGGVTAEKLIGCAETLLVALDSSVRELDETYPAALERFDARLQQSRTLLGSTTPEMERLEAISEALVGRTEEAEEMLRGQGSRLTEWLESTQGGLEANRALVERLRTTLDGAHQDATRITEGAGPLLVTALLRVKDTADQAAERARQALGRAIPDAAQQLAQASDEALQAVIGEKVTAQIEQVARVAEEAVKAAHQASERLTRQLLTIADTSASVEQRIEEAERASETRDRDHFARRSALLIESLNSTAIDVAKLLSNDVTDSAWSAYLKGDRGVFTRRAVKLLDAGESREIALHYDNDAEFRDHVNRYIHDFESMLRIILSARDGNALGVAVLSSDMGKLYVALAQAIERLRQ